MAPRHPCSSVRNGRQTATSTSRKRHPSCERHQHVRRRNQNVAHVLPARGGRGARFRGSSQNRAAGRLPPSLFGADTSSEWAQAALSHALPLLPQKSSPSCCTFRICAGANAPETEPREGLGPRSTVCAQARRLWVLASHEPLS